MSSKVSIPHRTLAGSGDDTIIVTANEIVSALTLDGGEGTDTLQLNGGGTFDLSIPRSFSSIEIIRGSAADDRIELYDDYWFTDLLNGIHTIEGGGGQDILSLYGWGLDLRDKTIIGFAEIELADYWGTEVTLNDKDLALQLAGYWSEDDRLILEGGTFDAAERKTLFDHGIDVIEDASGNIYTADRPLVTNLDAEIRLTSGQANQPVRLDVNADAKVSDGDDDTIDSLYISHDTLTAGEAIYIAQSAQIFLSNGMNVGSQIFVASPVAMSTESTWFSMATRPTLGWRSCCMSWNTPTRPTMPH
jgi:hypothetical protein